jgi:hypothetical protein
MIMPEQELMLFGGLAKVQTRQPIGTGASKPSESATALTLTGYRYSCKVAKYRKDGGYWNREKRRLEGYQVVKETEADMRIKYEQRRREGWDWCRDLLFPGIVHRLLDVGFARYFFVWGKAGMNHERYRRALSLTLKGTRHFGGKIGSLKNKESIEKRGSYWYPILTRKPWWFTLYQMPDEAVATIRKRARERSK